VSRRGAKPKPTQLKVLGGTLRTDRANRNEPKPKRSIPRCPSHLSDEAKREWHRVAGDLADLGLLCRKFGVMVKSPTGFPMQSPYLAVANRAMEQIRALLAEFGMSPSSRTRVHAEPGGGKAEDEFDRWLAGRR